MTYEMKPLFRERMEKLLPDKEDFEKFEKVMREEPRNFIRCNTLKVSAEDLLKMLSLKWKVSQPFFGHPEIMIIESDLQPGELGRAAEHVLGYYYIQEISSMLPALALDPKEGEFVLDIAASPGSKTTQMAAMMGNKGTIIANDLTVGRVRILSANAERCGVSNTILTRKDGVVLCDRFAKAGINFDKILLDAPCSGEGTLRSSQKTLLMWNPKLLQKFSRVQIRLLSSALKCLKEGGSIVYSTCTHAPEENEAVVDFALRNFPVKMESINIPLKCREGITSWEGQKLNSEVSKACRIYPQDNDSEGFFVSKMTLMKEIK